MPTQMPVPQAQAAAQQPVMAQQPAITMEFLASLGDTNAQKQYLGDQIYPRVMAVDQAQAGRIVGKILHELPMEQIIENARDEAVLQKTIQAAIQSIAATEGQKQE